jgi:hypothetical protein
MATTDPVLHALVDLVQALEAGNGSISMWNPAYSHARQVIQEHVAPGGDRASRDATSDEGAK